MNLLLSSADKWALRDYCRASRAQVIAASGWHFDVDQDEPTPAPLAFSMSALLAQLYEDHAVGCVEAAAKADDPKHREMLLKLAHEWMREAAALRAWTQSRRR